MDDETEPVVQRSPTLLSEASSVKASSSRGGARREDTDTDKVAPETSGTRLQAVEDPDWETTMSMRPSQFSEQVNRAIRLSSHIRATGDVSAQGARDAKRSCIASQNSSQVRRSPTGRSVIFHVNLEEAMPADSETPDRGPTMEDLDTGGPTPTSLTPRSAASWGIRQIEHIVDRVRPALNSSSAASSSGGGSQPGSPRKDKAWARRQEEPSREFEIEQDSDDSEEWEGQMPAHRRRQAALTTRVSYLLEHNGLDGMPDFATNGGIFDGLGPATFLDRRWANAMDYLKEQGVMEDEQQVLDLLRRGAQSFGIWSVSDAALAGLGRHVLDHGSEKQLSGPLAQWIEDMNCGQGCTIPGSRTTKLIKRSPTVTSQAVKEFKAKKISTFNEKRVELWLLFFVLVTASCLTIPWKPDPISKTFGAGLVIARITGVGSLLWTALLFFSMARTLIKGLYECMPARSRAARYLDAHEHIHKYCGKMFGVFGVVHTIAHLLSTYRIAAQESFEKVNAVLKCASSERPLLGWVTWPPCPLPRQYGYYELIGSLTGLTGFALLAVVALMARTAVHAARKKNFERFQLVHNIGMLLIIVCLFLHGVQGWFGIGLPLVLPFCLLPIGLYCVDRILRCLRYYLFRGHNVMSAVIRAGKKGGPDGALTFLQIAKPPHLWHFKAGMYAFLNLPEYSKWQWHPFTIVSGVEDDTVDFIVAGAGDWTRALAQKCLDYKNELRPEFPMIVMDGPYAAPVTTAVNCQVLVAVGAGVGVTPFLALMARVVAMLNHEDSDDLKEVHFYWITRSADEYLFGRRHFTRIISDERLREKFFFHLHLTLQQPSDDAAAFIFREAVRRQSIIDREAFLPMGGHLEAKDLGPHGLSVPCCWLQGAHRQDVFWVSSLVEADDEEMEEDVAECYRQHSWAQGTPSVRMTQAMSCNRTTSGKRSLVGPLFSRRPSSKYTSFNEMTSTGSMCQVRTAKSARSGSDPNLVDIAEDRTSDTVLNVVSASVRAQRQASEHRSMIPIIFGRPDFLAEIQAVGKAWPDFDVDVYVCGNDFLTESIRDICNVCTHKAAQMVRSNTMGFNVTTERTQRFNFRCENFS